MPEYAIIDTEGSGLFKYKDADGKPVPADAEGQPRLAQLAIIYTDENFEIQRVYDGYVRPDGWKMEPDAAAINGLTDEFLNKHGMPVVEVLNEYQNAIAAGRVVVAFNAQHDTKQLRGELRRAGLDDMFEETRNICVMRGSAGCGMRPDGKKTWPKLEHIAAFLAVDNAHPHKALNDAEIAWRAAAYLRSIDRLPEPAIHRAKNHPNEEA